MNDEMLANKETDRVQWMHALLNDQFYVLRIPVCTVQM